MLRRSTSLLGLMLTLFIVSMALWLAWSGTLSRAASSAPWQMVLLHHAPYSSGLHGSMAAMQWPYQAWGADAVLAGHDHDYERLQVGKIPYFVNGLGGMSRYPFLRQVAGSQARYSADYGAMLVTASETAIR